MDAEDQVLISRLDIRNRKMHLIQSLEVSVLMILILEASTEAE